MPPQKTAEAVSYYHDLLEHKYLEETVDLLTEAIPANLLTVNGRSVCNVLRPQFVDASTYAMILRGSKLVMRGFRELSARLLADTSLRAKLELSADEEEIIHIETGYGPADVSARLDGFLDAQGHFRFVEYNADSPGGLAFGDVLAEVFANLSITREFANRFPFDVFPSRSRTLDALLSAYHRWGGRGVPEIAIVDWRTALTRNEFVLMQQHFAARGFRVSIVDPEELDYTEGRLYANGRAIDLVYKRLVVFELIDRLGLNHPLVRAVRDRSVCMANGFAVQMLFQKSLFAMLNDPEIFQPSDPQIAGAIRAHVPWSRLVRECKTDYNGMMVDLIQFISENKDRLVLKPSSEYGGKGVQLGWECSDQEWADALKAALSTSFIVQERVQLGTELYPSVTGGKLELDQRYFDLDPYVWHGSHVDGCGVRLSRSALLNVSAGGGSATPLFILR